MTLSILDVKRLSQPLAFYSIFCYNKLTNKRGDIKMVQTIKTETIALSEAENKAFELVISVLEYISGKTSCTDIEEVCNGALENIYTFLTFTEES